MYNWIDGRRFSSSKSLPTLCLNSKQFNSSYFNPRNGFELGCFNQLPVIKEENGSSNEEEVLFLQSSLLKKNLENKSSSFVIDSTKHLKNLQRIKNTASITKLPPLLNINCLMNIEIKHKQAIWNTNFGKRLINQKNFDENFNRSNIKGALSNEIKESCNKLKDNLFSKTSLKGKCIEKKSIKNSGLDKIDYTQLRSNKKKPKKIKKNCQKSTRKMSVQEINYVGKSSESQMSEKLLETSSNEALKDFQTVSSFSGKQKFLTECVKSILDCHSTQIVCDYCKETLENIEEFQVHKKQHEAEKEVCLLCEKVFYNSNKFIQHLLTHEGVDRFSCKKCKKYFPNLKKYNEHCQNFHMTTDLISNKDLQNMELAEKCLLKFECKRCKMEFNTEKDQENHRRDHIKKDLTGAYLLTPKNIIL